MSYDVGELETLVSKGSWVRLTVDFVREKIGEDASAEGVQAEIVRRLDILHTAGIVSRTVPKRVPRS